MKKIVAISLSCLIILVLGCVIFLNISNDPNKLYKEVQEKIVNQITNFDKHITDYRIKEKGIMSIDAKYKGAHGESYPANFKYNVALDGNTLNMEDELGYGSLKIDEKVMNIYLFLLNLDISSLKTLTESVNVEELDDSYIYNLDVNKINKNLNTNYDKVYVKTYVSGLIKKVDYYELVLDDLRMTFKDNKINLKDKTNEAEIVTNSSGYSLVLNKVLKMNVTYNKDNVEYNVVINNNVLYFKTMKDSLEISLSGQAAIYYGLSIKVNYQDVDLKLNKIVEDENIIPLIRYTNNIDYSFWE